MPTILERAFSQLVPKQANVSRPAVGQSPQFGSGSFVSRNSYDEWLQAYGNSGWLFSVVSRISTSVASAQWELFERRGRELVEIEEHPLLDLWNNPNPFFTHDEFFETAQQHLDLTGESFWLLVRAGQTGPIVEMWPVRPDRMQPVKHPTEFIAGYLYTPPGATKREDVIPLRREDVAFIRMPNPMDPYRGMGPVQSILSDLDTERFASQYNRNFFFNSAEPGGIIEYPEVLDDADFEKALLRWREQHQGVHNAHRVAMIEGGTWKDRKFTQREMQFDALRNLNRDLILGAFSMPKIVMGVTDDVNLASAKMGDLVYSKWVVTPRLTRLRSVVNAEVVSQFGEDLFIDFKSVIPDERELDLDEAERGYKAAILTRNEARKRLGEDEVDGGDDFSPVVIDSAPQPQTKAIEAKQPESRDNLEEQVADAWERRLQDEAEGIADYLEQFKGLSTEMHKLFLTKVQESDTAGWDWNWQGKYGPAVEAELIQLFEASVIATGGEQTMGQIWATEYARQRSGELLTQVSETTRNRVRELTAQTIRDGESLNTLQRNIRDDFGFSRSRAEMIARTETATAWGQGGKRAALAQGRDEKRWLTQGDDRVDPECIRNEMAGWIKANEAFPTGHDTIPVHQRCRCDVLYRTAELAMAASAPPAQEKPVARVAEHRCEECNQLLAKDVQVGNKAWCWKCKQERELKGGAEPIPLNSVRKSVERDEYGRIASVTEETYG